jgi:tetratricopeptide (TPR) repeat protein
LRENDFNVHTQAARALLADAALQRSLRFKAGATLAVALDGVGRSAEAVLCFGEAVALLDACAPGSAEAAELLALGDGAEFFSNWGLALLAAAESKGEPLPTATFDAHPNTAAARASFARGARVDGTNVAAWFNLGRLERQAGRAAEAAAHFGTALRLEPADPTIVRAARDAAARVAEH